MSAQPTSPATAKQSYAAAVASQTAVAVVPNSGVYTRAMATKVTVNAAAASLRATKVPTKERTYTVSSIMAAASAIIARTSSPNMKVISPKAIEASKPSCEASVLTIGASTVEEQMQEMRRMLEQVLKDNEEKNKKIKDLQREVVKLGKQKLDEITTTIMPEDGDDNKTASTTEIVKADSTACNENQLKVLIANVVKNHLTGNPSGGARYTKPYSKRIDTLRMPQGYQPPKFQQFGGKENPKQHVAHFVETCSNAGTEGDLLVKQFVRSLKGIAFDWYTDLNAESIDSWEHLEDEFFNRFYSTRRVVSMSELTNTKQWEEEPVVDYINRWRTLCLECKDRVSETSAVEMCIDGMNWELLYILKGNKPKSFQELATRAHDMEITLRGHKHSSTTSSKAFRKMEHEEIEKDSQNLLEETMAVSTNNASQKGITARDFERTRPTWKELQAKKYPFPDSDLPGMLDDLLEKGVIKLPETRRPDEVNQTNNPKYCHYHRLVSHNLENCITFKELIMRLIQEGRIVLDTDETAEVNHTSSTTCHCLPDKSQKWSERTIQYGTTEPAKVWTPKSHGDVPKRDSSSNLQIRGAHHLHKNDDGWTLVTRRKSKKKVLSQPQIVPGRTKRRGSIKSKHLQEKKKTNAINNNTKEKLDDKNPNTKCTNRPPIQWRKCRMKSKS